MIDHHGLNQRFSLMSSKIMSITSSYAANGYPILASIAVVFVDVSGDYGFTGLFLSIVLAIL